MFQYALNNTYKKSEGLSFVFNKIVGNIFIIQVSQVQLMNKYIAGLGYDTVVESLPTTKPEDTEENKMLSVKEGKNSYSKCTLFSRLQIYENTAEYLMQYENIVT